MSLGIFCHDRAVLMPIAFFKFLLTGRKIKRKFTKQPKDDNKLVNNEEVPEGTTTMDENENSDGECDLGTVSQINNVKYSVNGTVKMYPKAPASNTMAPRGEPGARHNEDIVDILGQAEAALEENAMKDAGKNTKSGSFASSSDGMDLGMGAEGVPAPLGSPTRRLSKKGVMIDYDMDSEPGDTLTFDLTVEDQNQKSLVDDSEA